MDIGKRYSIKSFVKPNELRPASHGRVEGTVVSWESMGPVFIRQAAGGLNIAGIVIPYRHIHGNTLIDGVDGGIEGF